MASGTRAAKVERRTNETDIQLALNLGGGAVLAATGVGFLDHMLELLGRHGRLGLEVRARGTSRPAPTTPSRTSGSRSARRSTGRSGDRAGITRYAHVELPMDESLARCTIDISGRPYCHFRSDLPPVTIAGFEAELTGEFFRAVAANAKLTLHLSNPYGANAHHMIEACFKAFARALRIAVAIDPGEAGVPSTKGTLSS